MKKKIIISSIVLLLLAGGGYVGYLFMWQPADNLRPIYLVPEDAIYILETVEPVKNWQDISSSGVWQHMQGNAYFASLTEGADYLTELIESNAMMFKAIGSRQVMISAHMTRPDDYDFLYIIDLQEASKLKSIRNYLQNFTGSDYKLTKRDFGEQEIYELVDVASQDMLSLAFINNLLVLSYTHLLVEKSIEQMAKPVIGRDLYFTDVSRKVAEQEMFRCYVQYAYLDEYLQVFMGEDEDDYLKPLTESLRYSALKFDMEKEQGMMKASGFTNLNEASNSYLKALAASGGGKLEILQVAPERTGFYLGLGFDSFWEFFENVEKTLATDTVAYQEYLANVDRLERFLDINIQEHFLEWIDDEIAFVQTQPTGLGRDNEFAVVLKAKSSRKATENLNFIGEQIRKKTPVKFKSVPYQGFEIRFLSIKGFFRLMLGKLFAKLDKPYYAVIGDFVVFSNHPQTIRSIIDDFNDGKTLARNEQFVSFQKAFDKSSGAFAYIQTPVMLKNLKPLVERETWQDLQKNKDYIECFSHVGFQLVPDGKLLDTRLVMQFQPISQIREEQQTALARLQSFQIRLSEDTLVKETVVEEEEIMKIEEILPDDLTAKKHQEFFENGTLKLEVPLKNGLKHGTFREYYESGELKLKGKYKDDAMTGVWKMYDENGKVIERKRY